MTIRPGVAGTVSPLRASVRAERGATITSLCDGRGHEWLLPPAPSPIGGYPADTAFVDAEMGGWDECAPTIVPCTAPGGQALPDHGSLWDRPWTEEASSTEIVDRALGIRFRRAISAGLSRLRLDYRADVDRRTPMLWAAHPQFRAPAGTRVVLEADEVIDVLDERVARAWTQELAAIDSVPAGHGRKVYVPPDRPVSWARLEVPGQGRLTLRWDPELVPYLGLWFDNRWYAREPVIAIEPSTGYFDSLDAAVRADRVLWLEPGTPAQWWLEVTVDHD